MRYWSSILAVFSLLWSLVWAPGLAVADDTWSSPLAVPEVVDVSSHLADYSVQFMGQEAHVLSMRRGQSHNFVLTVKNTGTSAWSKGVVHLGTDRPQDRTPGFVREDIVGNAPSGWINPNRIEWMDAKTTALPGEAVTFSFWMSAPYEMALGIYREYFRVVADGITWMDDLGIYWEITVTDGPHFTIVSQNPYPATLKGGQSYKFVLTVQNTGPTTWTRNGAHPTRIGTDRPRDRAPGFIREDRVGGNPSGWVTPTRVKMKEPVVAPNASATFEFWYTVPETMESGTYREYFRPVVEGVGWLDDYGIFWDISVDNVPPQPGALGTTAGVGTLTISWPSVPFASYYTVRYREQGAAVFVYEDTRETRTTISGLKGGVPYEVGVASRKDGMESPYKTALLAPEVEVLTPPAPAISGGTVTTIIPPTPPQPTEVTPIGQPSEKDQQNRFFVTLAILFGIATAVAAGYYAYDWWLEKKRRESWAKARPVRLKPPKPRPPSSTRW